MKITNTQATIAFEALTKSIAFKNEVNKYAASRNIKKLKPIVEDVEEYSQEQRLIYCFKDKDNCPVRDEKGALKFDVEKEKEFNKQMKIFMAEEVEFEPYKFRANTEILSWKYTFLNSDLDFLLDESMLKEPEEEIINRQNNLQEN